VLVHHASASPGWPLRHGDPIRDRVKVSATRQSRVLRARRISIAARRADDRLGALARFRPTADRAGRRDACDDRSSFPYRVSLRFSPLSLRFIYFYSTIFELPSSFAPYSTLLHFSHVN